MISSISIAIAYLALRFALGLEELFARLDVQSIPTLGVLSELYGVMSRVLVGEWQVLRMSNVGIGTDFLA
jgi:hypothetical protein